MTPSLFTREEAATILKISVPSLDLYTKTSQLNPIYLGSRVLYEEKELNRFIRAMKKQPRGCRGQKCRTK